METPKRITKVEVTKLLNNFNYSIEFPSNSDTIILIAPNGYGKTAFLSLINSCLSLQPFEIYSHSFETLTISFSDKTTYIFRKITGPDLSADDKRSQRDRVELTSIDTDGLQTDVPLFLVGDLSGLPKSRLTRIIDSYLPVGRTGLDTFRDLNTGKTHSLKGIIDTYFDDLIQIPEFRELVGERASDLPKQKEHLLPCVFIQTQRLLLQTRSGDERLERMVGPRPEEEINRQASKLASDLKAISSTYAETSQSLDRTFPNRLIDRVSQLLPKKETNALMNGLAEIERRRKDLTEAGLLVDLVGPLTPPKEEVLQKVAEALEIYIEDSRIKLDTYKAILPKVSTFREILNRKLHRKEVVINPIRGIDVRQDGKSIDLARLSSGEKHEFVMLFKLVFETPQHSLVLIDEPEISLHVLWQLEFMADIQRIQSANPVQTIIATHSPEIFQSVPDLVIDLADQT